MQYNIAVTVSVIVIRNMTYQVFDSVGPIPGSISHARAQQRRLPIAGEYSHSSTKGPRDTFSPMRDTVWSLFRCTGYVHKYLYQTSFINVRISSYHHNCIITIRLTIFSCHNIVCYLLTSKIQFIYCLGKRSSRVSDKWPSGMSLLIKMGHYNDEILVRSSTTSVTTIKY